MQCGPQRGQHRCVKDGRGNPNSRKLVRRLPERVSPHGPSGVDPRPSINSRTEGEGTHEEQAARIVGGGAPAHDWAFAPFRAVPATLAKRSAGNSRFRRSGIGPAVV